MALRKKSYSSAANKGKVFDVFVNNLLVNSEKKRKERQLIEKQKSKSRAIESRRRDVAESRKRDAESARDEKERINQQKKSQKTAEQNQRKRLVKEEKYKMFLQRSRIECQKVDLDPICYELVAQEAMEAGVTVAQIGNVVIKGREQYWNDKVDESKEEEYIQTVRKSCEIIRKEKGILDRLEENLVAEIIESNLEIHSIRNSEIIDKYLQESKQILLDVASRLEAHTKSSIYEKQSC